MNHRIDFLLLPEPAALPAVVDVGRRVLAEGFEQPHFIDIAAGGYRLLAVCESARRHVCHRPVDGGEELRELNWPEPVGCRIARIGSAWTVESDYIAFRPVYHAPLPGGHLAVSSRPDLLAALIGRRLSAEGLLEQLLIGFHLGRHTPFDLVSRLSEGEHIVVDGDGGRVVDYAISDPQLTAEGSWITQTAEVARSAFDRGYLLEMSGGIDNRLVLALAFSTDSRPRGGFTIGPDSSQDVQIARTVAARFDIPHQQILVDRDTATLVADGKHFAALSGFSMNASYAGLVGVLEQLAGRRDGQVGGLGGEFALGSYYTPFDRLMALRGLRPLWVKYRLVRAGVADDVERFYSPSTFESSYREIVDHALKLFDRTPGTWRQKADEFYIREKLRQFNGIVLTASARWYHPVHPLHFHSHLAYARDLATRSKKDRQTQMRLISRLAPDLGAIPYYGQRRVALSPYGKVRERVRFARATARKLLRRLTGQKSHADLGAIDVVGELFQRPEVRQSLADLSREDGLGLVENLVEVLDAQPASRREHEIGVLIVAAWARESVAAIAASLAVAAG